jgi:carboxymethylenebutenolidase
MHRTLVIHTPDGSFSAYVAQPPALPAPVIVVLQEIFGVNPDIRQTADELATHGFLVVCPDLFWRQGANIELSDKTDWNQGLARYQAYDRDQGVADIAAVLHAARTVDGGNGKVGLMGFCLGGLMTYLTAVRVGVDAGAWYYGGSTDDYLAEAANLTDPFLMHVGAEDEFISSEAQKKIAAAVKNRSNVELNIYPGCSHAFSRHRGNKFDAEAAAMANLRTVAFFKAHLL